MRKRTGLQLFAALFFMLFSSCTSVPPLRDTGGSVPCPESFSSVRLIKDYISQMRSVNPFLQGIYDRLLSGIFRDALDSLDLGECPVSRMYEWINFCRGLTENTGATALTYGYKDSGGYHLVLLVDYGFAFSPEGVIASLVAHEMIHAYCDHSNLPAGESFHEQWFDYIASAVEKQSMKYGYDPFYFYLRNIYRN
ncbi:MAG: hypothetical protein II563_06550 [Treponema sp.]|nr:hypothetical protein [Treponema sp.]